MRALSLSLGLYAAGCGGAMSSADVEQSEKAYELALGLRQEGNAPGAYKMAYQAIEMNPYNVDAHLALAGWFLVERDDHPEYDAKAEHHFRQVLEIQAGDHKSEKNVTPAALNGLGVLYIHQRKYKQAVTELQKATEDMFNPDAFMVWGNLGWAQLMLADYPAAMDALTRAVKMQPRFCVGHQRLGEVHLALKDYVKAEEAFTAALEADERCAGFQTALHRRGQARMNLGNREDARLDFERCVEIGQKTEDGKACMRLLDATH